MPETSGNTTVTIELTEWDLQEMFKMLQGETKVLSGNTVTRRNDGSFKIESEQEVSLEFDLGDYAPERDEC